jgi:hypothetical protein
VRSGGKFLAAGIRERSPDPERRRGDDQVSHRRWITELRGEQQ